MQHTLNLHTHTPPDYLFKLPRPQILYKKDDIAFYHNHRWRVILVEFSKLGAQHVWIKRGKIVIVKRWFELRKG